MRVAGIVVEPNKGRPLARLVVVSNSGSGPIIESSEKFSSADVDVAEQLHDMAVAIGSRLTGLGVDRVVIRRADLAKVPSNKPTPQYRVLAEGALLAACRSVVPDTVYGSGKELGQRCGKLKDLLDADAAALASTATAELAAVGQSQKATTEAVAAGIAGLSEN